MNRGFLRFSSNSDRYCVGEHGPELTTGERCAIRIGGDWVRGTVEHSASRYAIDGQRGSAGYIFLSDDGEVCGLCYGMLVRTTR